VRGRCIAVFDIFPRQINPLKWLWPEAQYLAEHCSCVITTLTGCTSARYRGRLVRSRHDLAADPLASQRL
jgi:hypothetical protein